MKPATLGAGVAIALLAALATSQTPPTGPPTGSLAGCTTSGCHDSQIDHRFLHGPVAAGVCTVCHVPADPATHRFTLAEAGTALCVSCHGTMSDAGGTHLHAPVAEGQCADCHDPHGAAHPMLLPAESTVQFCRTCHSDVGVASRLHAGEGDCLACHRPHASDHDALLIESRPGLCVQCHDDVLEPRGEAPTAPGATVIHGPVATACLPCHDPHGTTEPSLLRQPLLDLCLGCHGEAIRRPGGTVHRHAAPDGRACLSCHEPHAGRWDHMLTAAPPALCLSCHGQEIVRRDGSTVADVSILTRPDAHRHPPVDVLGCDGCHEVHGSELDSLVLREFPNTFYHAFDRNAYALCLDCHDEESFTTPHTTTLTGFRDGDRNLHYVHVAAQESSGRTCRVCHDPHASLSSKLMRREVPFGRWTIPIRHEPTKAGGQCAAGCHRAQSYDRSSGG